MNMKLLCRQMEALLGIMHIELAETKRGAQQRTWPRFSAAPNSAVSKRACYRPLTLEGALGKWLLWELVPVASDDMNAQLFSFPTSYTKWDMNKFFLT